MKKTLIESAPMTEKEGGQKIGSLQTWQLRVLGDLKILEGKKLILRLPRPSGRAIFFEHLARDAEMQKAWLTMKTTTNHCR